MSKYLFMALLLAVPYTHALSTSKITRSIKRSIDTKKTIMISSAVAGGVALLAGLAWYHYKKNAADDNDTEVENPGILAFCGIDKWYAQEESNESPSNIANLLSYFNTDHQPSAQEEIITDAPEALLLCINNFSKTSTPSKLRSIVNESKRSLDQMHIPGSELTPMQWALKNKAQINIIETLADTGASVNQDDLLYLSTEASQADAKKIEEFYLHQIGYVTLPEEQTT